MGTLGPISAKDVGKSKGKQGKEETGTTVSLKKPKNPKRWGKSCREKTLPERRRKLQKKERGMVRGGNEFGVIQGR